MLVPCTIDVDFSHFKRVIKRAVKRHRSLPEQLSTIFAAIEADALSQGDRIPGYGSDLHLRKVRVGVPRERIPPSGGYRLILQLIEANGKTTARCLDLYYKPEQSDITTSEGVKLIRDAANDAPE